MSKLIQVLEQMNSDAKLQDEQAIKQLLRSAEMDTEQAEAIINKDISSLERQLNVRLDMVCGVVPAEDDDENEEKDEKEDNATETTNNCVVGL